MYSIFPNGKIPAPPSPDEATIETVSLWMLVVLPIGDARRRIVAGVYAYWLDRGYTSDRQLGAVRAIFDRTQTEYFSGLLGGMIAENAK